VDSYCFGMETHEQVIDIERTVRGCEDQEMVVGGEQLEDPGDFRKGAYCIDTGADESIARIQLRP